MYFQMKFILEDCEPSRLIIKVYISFLFVRKLGVFEKTLNNVIIFPFFFSWKQRSSCPLSVFFHFFGVVTFNLYLA